MNKKKLICEECHKKITDLYVESLDGGIHHIHCFATRKSTGGLSVSPQRGYEKS